MKKIEEITNINPSTQLISKINQEINKCHNALNDLCENLLYSISSCYSSIQNQFKEYGEIR